MTLRDLIAGLQIIAKYDDGDVDCQHDEIYAGSTDPALMEAADREALERLGWSYQRADQSWRHFT